jgi:hypothetical protein
MSHDDAARIGRALTSAGQPDPALVTVYLPASGSFPQGAKGRVTRVDTPSVGAEYVQVAVNGDELPFAPSELMTAAPSPAGTPAPVQTPPVVRPPAAKKTVKKTPRKVPAKKTTPRNTSPGRKPPVKKTSAVPAPVGAGRDITITIRHGSDGWTIDGTRGRRRLTRKPHPVSPGAVVAAVDLLGAEQVAAEVRDIIDIGRRHAEQQAAAARRAYDEAASVLALFDAPGVTPSHTEAPQ